MKQVLIIFLVSLIVSFGAMSIMYKTEVGDMINIAQNKIDEWINGPQDPSLLVIESIAVDAGGAKTVFDFGEEFTYEGLKVIGTMKNGKTTEVDISDCKISSPDTCVAGVHQITVSYDGIVATYEITVNLKVIPPISETPLLNITESNHSYRVEAEAIDMDISGVKKAQGISSFVASADSSTTSGGQYITGYNVKWNYFGFTFTAADDYDNSTLVLRVANSAISDIDAGEMKMFLNFSQDEAGVASGGIALDGYIIEAKGAAEWTEIVLRNVDIPKGTNTLTFEVQNKKAFDIDYIDFYIGMPYVKSLVELNGVTTVVKDIETLDTEKAFTRTDVANAHNLKPGQLFVEPVKNSAGKTTSGDTSVGAIGNGSQISTTLYLGSDATVRIKFKAAKTGSSGYYVADNWKFNIDGINIVGVERVNIEGGSAKDGLYWDWFYTTVGTINLPAGYHSFIITIDGADCNVDTVDFEVISYGSFHESGMGLEDMHSCTKPCNICGKCTNIECTKSICANNRCGGHDGSLTISGKGDYKVEAEELDLGNLTPSAGQTAVGVETPSATTPPTSGGRSIGRAGGGYVTFTLKLQDKATVQIYGAIAYANGGEAANFLSATIGDEPLAIFGTMPVGTAENRYWNWVECPFGTVMDLEAGEYVVTVNFIQNPNVDYFKAVVYSYGEFTKVEAPACTSICEYCGKCNSSSCAQEDHTDKCACPEIDVKISADTVAVTIEAETFDNSQVITSSDQVAAGRLQEGTYGTESGNGATCIFGFTKGTKFTIYVASDAAREMEMLLVGAAGNDFDVPSNLALSVNGEAVTVPASNLLGSGSTPYWDWKTVSFGRIALKEGLNEVVISVIGGAPNMDKIKFVSVKPDITVATTGTTTLHMENFDEHKSLIDTKDDFINAYASQGMKEGDVYHSAQNGRIYGFNASTFVMHVEVQEACTINISMNLWNCNPLNTYSYSFGGQVIECTNTTAPAGAGQYEIGSVTVTEAGVYTFIFTTGGVDFDEVIFTVAE